MSAEASIPLTPPPRVWPMYRAMVGIGVLCGALIVTVFQVTKPVIDRNKAEALQRAIFQVLPDARSSTAFRLAGDGFEVLEGEGVGERLVYAGYDEQERLVGLAIEAQGMGYQDVIRVLYGYSFEHDAIVGIRVLESKETPGLGDKIEKDPDFTANFERLDVTLTEDLSTLVHPIEAVKHGRKTDPWQVDGITGATISSFAIGNILNQSASHWVPLIRRNLETFREVG
jgi:electron transport complex protein RnfG